MPPRPSAFHHNGNWHTEIVVGERSGPPLPIPRQCLSWLLSLTVTNPDGCSRSSETNRSYNQKTLAG